MFQLLSGWFPHSRSIARLKRPSMVWRRSTPRQRFSLTWRFAQVNWRTRLGQEFHALFKQVDDFATNSQELRLKINADRPVHQNELTPKLWSQFLFLSLDSAGAPPEALDLSKARRTFSAIRLAEEKRLKSGGRADSGKRI